MPGLFVTATGTDVGKTYVTAGLIRAGRRAGLTVDALKPVLSGFAPDTLASSDAAVLLGALDRPVTSATVAAIAPWRFVAPLSPDMAAEAEGRRLIVPDVVEACRERMRPDALTLIEGVGGVMVPLDERHTVLDLMAALGLPVVLVSPTGLGAISHLLTALAARSVAPRHHPQRDRRRPCPAGRHEANAPPLLWRDPVGRRPAPRHRRNLRRDPVGFASGRGPRVHFTPDTNCAITRRARV